MTVIEKDCTIALVGNPNSGKSTLFNLLTGLNQKVGNYPGITVAINSGKINADTNCVDLPGAYSLHATSEDEFILTNILIDKQDPNYPDCVIYVADINYLEKQLLLFTQVKDLGFPVILVLNMIDLAEKDKTEVDIAKLEKEFPDTTIIPVSSKTGKGIKELKEIIHQKKFITTSPENRFYQPLTQSEIEAVDWMKNTFGYDNPFQSMLCLHHHDKITHHNSSEKAEMDEWMHQHQFPSLRLQIDDTMRRYDYFTPIVQRTTKKVKKSLTISDKIDAILTHRLVGPLLFALVMIFVFQAIFSWATYPMDIIENLMAAASGWVGSMSSGSWFTDLIANGLIPGIAGVLVFIPQIAILFLLISLLEEIGYMSRAVFMFDRIMQRFGLNGRSLVALISSGACAIPAIMSARTISNPKEKLITILVTPFISCSARIPVYAILVAFVVPSTTIWGIFNTQGLVFMGLYALGIIAAMSAALVLKKILPSWGNSHLMINLPDYRMPDFRNIWITVYKYTRSFVLEAGKIILIISMILWLLSSYGPGNKMDMAEQESIAFAQSQNLTSQQTENLIASKQLEASYAGHIGKFFEPVIKPLGYDWKIGIALFTSFAAREVFVGTMATIYSLGSAESELTIKDRMSKEVNRETGLPVYTLATALSLLVFYVLAMQCMSTLAVVKKETGTWKWPVVQFFSMTGLAYLASFLVFQLLS